MKLTENIQRIKKMMGVLNEQAGDKDLSKHIEKILNIMFVEPNKDLVCKVEVKHPKDIKILQGQPEYIDYRLTITFIGGQGTKDWPMTQAVHRKFEKLMDEAWFIVYENANKPVSVYSKYVKECDSN
jgi:hypothetical protein